MRKFSVKIFEFLIAPIIVFLMGHLIETLIIDKRIVPGNRYTFQGDWHDLANHNSDVIFIGNSRTCEHIDPFKFSKKTNRTSEVIAQNGQRAEILFLKFKQYLKQNNIPKCVVIQFDPHFYDEKSELTGILDYAPYFYQNRLQCVQYFKNKKGYNQLYQYVPLFAFMKIKSGMELLKNIILNKTIDSSYIWCNSKGFISQTNIPNFDHLPYGWKIFKKRKSPYIDSFFELAHKCDFNLVGIFTPQTKELNGIYKIDFDMRDEFYQLKVKYPSNGGFYDYSKISMSSDKSYFNNHSHFNRLGSDSFMRYLLRDSNFTKIFISSK